MHLPSVLASLAIHGLALAGVGLLDRPAASTRVAPALGFVVIAEPPPAPGMTTVAQTAAPDVRPRVLTQAASPSRARGPTSRRPVESVGPAAPLGTSAVVEESPVAAPAASENSAPVALGPAVVSTPQPAPPGQSDVNTPVRPRLLPPALAEGRLLINPQDERYRPVIPPALRRPGVRATPLLKVCVAEAGTVQSVTVLQASDAVLDPLIVAKVKTYLFRPSLHEGRPVPFCYAREFKLMVE